MVPVQKDYVWLVACVSIVHVCESDISLKVNNSYKLVYYFLLSALYFNDYKIILYSPV